MDVKSGGEYRSLALCGQSCQLLKHHSCSRIKEALLEPNSSANKHNEVPFRPSAKLGGVADAPSGCAAIQGDLDRPESWVKGNLYYHLLL